MKKLLYKEFKLSINKFFLILPIMLSLLLLIPNWLFMLVFMYFFWISIPNIYSGYIAQNDYSFTMLLPVTKADIVKSKAFSLIALELVHVVLAAIFGIIHVLIYGRYNFFIDVTPALFGYAFLMYGIFNILFLPKYFKTAYFFGKALVLGVAVTLIFGLGIEFLVFFPRFATIIDPQVLTTELLYLLVGVLSFIGLSFIAVKKSITNYENIS